MTCNIQYKTKNKIIHAHEADHVVEKEQNKDP